jgi:hypothetical protein
MKRRVSLLVAGAAIGLAGCILNFDGLTGGDVGGVGGPGGAGGAGGSGGSSCVDCALCEGSCTAEKCEPLLDVADNSITAFRLAASKGVLFASDPASSSGGVLRFTREEGSTLFETPSAPHALAVNEQHIFWSAGGEGLFRCEQAGCAKLVKLTPPGAVDTVARRLAADASALYWITGPDLPDGKIMRCTINACVPEVLATGLHRPHDMAIDDQYIYATAHGMEPTADGVILRVKKDGSEVTTLVSGLLGPSGIAVTATHVYFTLGVVEGKVYRCALGGSPCGPLEEITPTSMIAGMQIHSPMSVAVVGEWVYWTNDGDSTVMACPTAGCAATSDGLPLVVATGLSKPGGLIATSGCLFWTAAGGAFAATR